MSFAMKIIKFDWALAEDAVHETFVTVLKKRKQLLSLDDDSFRRMVIAITKNKSIDILRKNNKLSIFAFEDAAAGFESAESGFEAGVVEFHTLRGYLEKLDPISERILEMKYLEGLTYKQIATTLNMKPKTVEVRIARAKAKIRELLEKEGGDNEWWQKSQDRKQN